MNRTLKLFVFAGIAVGLAISAQAGNLITNGNFEGGSLAGWAVNANGCCANSFYIQPNNGSNTPVFGYWPTQVNPAGGNWFAISDQYGAGTETLSQGFTVGTGGGHTTLTFDWYNSSHTSQFGSALDYSDQVMRVDILTGSASAFDTGAGVVYNLLLNQDPNGTGNTTWYSSTFNFSLAPGSYQLRFATSQCCYFQEIGVDNVVLTASPEPGTFVMLSTGFLGLASMLRRKIKL